MAAAWQPYREPIRVTLTRTIGIAVVAGAVVAVSSGRFHLWPEISLVILWPSFGGHWIDLLFLNGLRPHLPPGRAVQRLARLAMWFAGGIVILAGAQLTARMLPERPRLDWLTWSIAGAVFVAIELTAHAVLYLRGRPSFYDGLG